MSNIFTKIIRSRAPVRLSFGGGGTDLSPYTEEKGGAVISTTINKYVYGTLIPKQDKSIKIISTDYKKTYTFADINNIEYNGDLDLIKAVIKLMKPDFGFELFLRSDVPPNTGLGSSGSVAVAMIGLFNHLRTKDKLNSYEIAELAFKVENEEIKNKGGRQDQYAAAFGGFNFIEFKGNNFVRVSPVKIPHHSLLELEKHIVLAFVGKRLASGGMQELLMKEQQSHLKEEKQRHLDAIKQAAYDMYHALMSGKLDEFGRLLAKGWEEKKLLTPQATNSHIDELYDVGIKHGALGAKITGAGSGGCMMFYCKSNTEQIVANKLEEAGAKVVDFSFETSGLQTWELNREDREITEYG
ncbi:GHMP kinase [Candidatus Woesearchaeota archaeon]|nr:GHMP kinase [Candidatus Woesearchaeota archaeon]